MTDQKPRPERFQRSPAARCYQGPNHAITQALETISAQLDWMMDHGPFGFATRQEADDE